MTIRDIVKRTIKELNDEKEVITPVSYQKRFCEIAKELKVDVSDCLDMDRYFDKLSPYLKEEFKKHTIKDLDEFIQFLISSLNRLSVGDASKQNLVLITLAKRLLQTITFLHDKEATKLANISLDRLEYLADINSIEMIKDKWFNFLTSYDDSYLNKLDSVCKLDSHNLEDIVENVLKCINQNTNQGVLGNLAQLVVASLNPSIAHSVDDELAELSYDLKSDPSLLSQLEIQERIKRLLKKRVQIDKEEVKSKVKSLNEILNGLSIKLSAFVDSSNIEQDKLVKIKNELRKNSEDIDFADLKKRLEMIAESLEVETSSLSKQIKKENDLINILQKRMHRLEVALQKAKKESKIDFLTKLYSRKSLDDELRVAESAYNRYGLEYSLVFFDIDNFKMINDTFGHETGDIILKELGKVIATKKREVDIVGRYGGEEFLAILPKTDLKGAYNFAEKLRSSIENHQFIYKDDRILVTISAGIASRKDNEGLSETIEEADRMLYNSKNSGRNKVSPDLHEVK